MERYLRNHNAISEAEQNRLRDARVLVAGCGGLGGYVIELLGRLGVGHITALDHDVFEPSNLNRQLLCAASTLGKSKAEAAKLRMADVNPEIEVIPLIEKLTGENALSFVQNHDLVVDALDSLQSRIFLLRAAQSAGIPFVHGAIAGWHGRVAVALPGDRTLLSLLEASGSDGQSAEGNLGFTASYTAALQAAEAAKLLLGHGHLANNMLLEFDLLYGEQEEIPLISG
jgi:molybdopterin/thiamine biosynthesis adenylyltransferase